MAAKNLEKMASIDVQLRLLAPGKVSEDDKLIEYDALLLDRFLDILQDLHGENLRETVQDCYELSAEYERKQDPQKLAELGNVLTSLDPGDSIVIAKSFSHMLNLANLAEEVQIAYRRRIKMKKKGDFADEASATTESDIEETLKRLVGDLKKSPEEVFDALKNQTVDLVFTAHPTQSVRRSLLQKHARIRNCLTTLNAKDITPDDKQELDESLQREIQAAFRTDEIRRTPPTPQDEMRAGMSYFHETIWKGVPKFLRRVDTALKNIGINERVPYNAPLIQFSSWMGGDRDGNPRVTPEVTRDVCLLARMMAANLYFSQIEDLMFELSMWRCNDELRARAHELHRSSKKDAKHYIEFWKQIPPNEPYRVILGDVRDKLYNTRERARQLLANGVSDIPEDTTFTNVEQFLEPLELCYQSLCSCGDRAIADGSLLDFLRQVSTFGLSLVRLDIRQESDRHTDVLNAISTTMFSNGYANNKNCLSPMPSASSSTTATPQTTSSSSSGTTNSQTQSLIKAYFKTPEGRYKLHSEKTRPPNLLPYSYAKSISQVTVAQLKDKPSSQPTLTPSFSTTGVRSAAARLLGGSGGKALNFVGGSGYSRTSNGSSRYAHFGGSNGTHHAVNSNLGGKGSFLVFNVGDTVYISDLNSPDKDPIKSLHFSNSNPVCHAFDSEAKDGHDLLIGLSSGDIYSASLRQQLQDSGKKLVGAHHYNKEGAVTSSRCTSVAWVPKGNGTFVAAHADGNLYVYEKSKESAGDSSFPAIKDHTQFSVAHARSSKSNPISRWHICQGSINSIVYSADGANLATVGRDGYLRVFDYSKEQLVFGGKSYYGALLCCSWSPDGKYILTGGEEDLVTVWSMEDRKVVAWGEGHNSWVSGVAFDSHWSPPSSDDTEENIVYRFGSVGQDTKLLLWDLPMDEIVVPLRRSSLGGSPTFSTGSQSSHWDSVYPIGTLQPAPSMRDIPKLSPLVSHCVHSEPLSGLLFTEDAILTASWEGHVKIWMRPGEPETKTNAEALLGASPKDQLLTGKGYTEPAKSKPFTESKSNNPQSLLGATSKEQQSLTGKGGAFNFKEISKSSRLGYLP